MATEIDLLKQDIPRLERKFGANNPFVELLKAQLTFLQNQAEQKPRVEQYHPELVKSKISPIRKRNDASNKQL
ncbi:MAG: hypothetical protein HOP23_14450 [Methylococcaceae bacterium]|nr:hypothetical protein [Methylococcaceae bacterium]